MSNKVKGRAYQVRGLATKRRARQRGSRGTTGQPGQRLVAYCLECREMLGVSAPGRTVACKARHVFKTV